MTTDRAFTLAFLLLNLAVAAPAIRDLAARWQASRPVPPGPADPPGFAAAWRQISDDLRRPA